MFLYVDVLMRQDELSDGQVQREPVDFIGKCEVELGARPVDAVAGSDDFSPRIEYVLGFDGLAHVLAAPYAEDGADGDVALDVGGAVEGVEGDVVLPVGCAQDDLAFFLRGEDGVLVRPGLPSPGSASPS
jgi:hypothetical protein